MSSIRHCPTCRAMLTEGQVSASSGACPYCRGRLGFGSPPEDPYAPPIARADQNAGPTIVPRALWGKLFLAVRLLLEQLPLFSALVLTVWIPAHLLIEAVRASSPNPEIELSILQLTMLIQIFFGPIYSAGILTALASRMSGGRTSYVEALQAGLHHWGRLFVARFISGMIIFLGFLALIIPGIILAIRYSQVDEAVVLEGAGWADARQRSARIVGGRDLHILLGGLMVFVILLSLNLGLVRLLQSFDLLKNPLVTAGCDCLLDIVALIMPCLMFVFYWETRQAEALQEDWPQEVEPAENED